MAYTGVTAASAACREDVPCIFETLSRVLRHLADTRCIAIERSEVRILNRDAMALLAGRGGT
jgi:hypothetical protein